MNIHIIPGLQNGKIFWILKLGHRALLPTSTFANFITLPINGANGPTRTDDLCNVNGVYEETCTPTGFLPAASQATTASIFVTYTVNYPLAKDLAVFFRRSDKFIFVKDCCYAKKKIVLTNYGVTHYYPREYHFRIDYILYS